MIDVVVVGAGPVGLWLAAELRLAAVGVVVLEERAQRSPHSRGLWIQPRTLEVLDMRGMADAHVSEGVVVPAAAFALMSVRLDMSVLRSPFPFLVALPQARTEELFLERALALGAEVRLGHRVTDVSQYGAGVDVTVEGPDGSSVAGARFVVGCDGARSVVREAAGIEFDGRSTTRTAMLADVELVEPPERGVLSVHRPRGSVLVVPLPGGLFRLVVKDTERLHVPRSAEVTLEEVRESARRVLGTDLGARNPVWLARVGNAARLARAYRRGRILLAGDAAHIHPPQGGQGLNLGVQDAMNLGWKLAAEVNATTPPWLLDSYERERRPVAEDVVKSSCAQEELASATTPDQMAVKELLAEILAQHSEANRSLAEKVGGLAIAYPADEGSHPLVGHRAPDLELDRSSGRTRLFELLRDGHFALLVRQPSLTPSGINRTAVNVATVPKEGIADWGEADTALVRPDGYFAWVGQSTYATTACARWREHVEGMPTTTAS